MGITMDEGKLESLRRIGGSKVLESLQDLGTYFDQQKGNTISTPGPTPRSSQGGRIQSSVSSSPQNKAITTADGPEDNRRTKTLKEVTFAWKYSLPFLRCIYKEMCPTI